jgi:hypothetical protein
MNHDQPELPDDLVEIVVMPDDRDRACVIEIDPLDKDFSHYPPARVTFPTLDSGRMVPRDYLLTGELDHQGRRVYRSRRH